MRIHGWALGALLGGACSMSMPSEAMADGDGPYQPLPPDGEGGAEPGPTPEPAHSLEVAADPPKTKPVRDPPGLGTCTFIPEARCTESLVFEISIGGGQIRSDFPEDKTYWLSFTGGYLKRVAPNLEVGPVFELAVSGDEIVNAWNASPTLRARYFVGGSGFVIEHGIGLQFERFGYLRARETGTRVGATTDLGFGFRGIAGPFAQISVLGDPGGNDGRLLHWIAGVRLNLAGLAFAVAGAFGQIK